MLPPHRPILSQLCVTTLTALAVTCAYVYLTGRRQPPLRPTLIQHRLASQVSIDFTDARLDAVFQHLSHQLGIPIDVDWTTLQAAGIDRDYAVSLMVHEVPASRALDMLIGEMGCGAGPILYAERDKRLVVSHVSVLTTSVVRLYDVEDLLDEYVAFRTSVPNEQYKVVNRGTLGVLTLTRGLSDDPRAEAIDDLTTMLMGLVDPDSWIQNGGRVGDMHYRMRRLVVAQTPQNHQKIERILAAIRKRGVAPLSNRAATEQ